MERAELARRLGGRLDRVADAPARLICEAEPARFMVAFAAGVAGGGPVFLGDPGWARAQREQADAIVAGAQRRGLGAEEIERGWLMIPSGGTSGRLKFARHDTQTLGAAITGFAQHFGFERIHAVNVLPLQHVSGLMAWLRCIMTAGTFTPWNWAGLEAGERPPIARDGGVISLVPTQLERLLRDPTAAAWLRRFSVIFLGGGPVWPDLAERAAALELPMALSYGMTESGAMVTALRPAEFLAGSRSSGRALPHARVAIGSDERIQIEGESLFHGYWPGWNEERTYLTDDLGRFDARQELHVLGRREAMIITGGKKVFPTEVEAALRASGEFTEVVVLGLPDPEWGEVVVACYPADAAGRVVDAERAGAALASFQRPKRYVAVPEWPSNAQGKVNRPALVEMVKSVV